MKSRILRRCCAPVAATLGLLAMGAAPALATATSTNTPLSGTVTNTCNGDVVTFNGTAHIVLETTNNTTQASVHEDLVNASGVGAPSGDRYRLVTVGNAETSEVSAFEATATIRIEYVSQGSDPNFFADEVVHITFNANGQMTAVVENVTPEGCSG